MAVVWSTLMKWAEETWATIIRKKSDKLELDDYIKAIPPTECSRCRSTGMICKHHFLDAWDDCMCDDPIPCPGEEGDDCGNGLRTIVIKPGTTWFVDLENGDDSKSGLSMEEAVKDPAVIHARMSAPSGTFTIKSPPCTSS